ncbi:hypothetical protein F5B20DRAFT_578960 [Whalleya microplaca]|nr:hypothetical protein F5B20DRAFT_578960 [Whalleya microplaca]
MEAVKKSSEASSNSTTPDNPSSKECVSTATKPPSPKPAPKSTSSDVIYPEFIPGGFQPGKSTESGNSLLARSSPQLLSIDLVHQVAIAEPGVSVGQLVTAFFKSGLLPLIFAGFPEITAGDSHTSTTAESSSCRYCFFEPSFHSLQMRFAHGDQVVVSPNVKGTCFKVLLVERQG